MSLQWLCDCCETTVDASGNGHPPPSGWVETERGDFCSEECANADKRRYEKMQSLLRRAAEAPQ